MTPDVRSQLADLGFERITRWVSDEEGIRLESLKWKDAAGWIYAYVSQDRIRYIGITTMVLKSRMDSYRDLARDRVRPLIRSLLDQGHDVEVYGLRRPGIAKRELEVEESRLIRALRSDWNVKP